MLKSNNCVPCQGGIPPLNEKEVKKFMSYISDEWIVLNGIKLTKTYSFEKYIDAVDFSTKVASLAENQGHHPHIHINFKDVKIFLFTHKINGLHENDFLMAKKVDDLY
jgi:4a-hydroxytetrahydrobiopterin dehydratase